MNSIDDFRKEAAEYSTDDIKLILTDQTDLYSDDEINILKDELKKRGESADNFDINGFVNEKLEETAQAEEAARIIRMQKEAEERERARLQSEASRIDALKMQLKAEGKDGYWQYQVVSLADEGVGSVSPRKLADQMNELGLRGWKLACAYSNEIWHNSHTAGMMGVSANTNSTIDQNVLIFEKYIKI